MADLPFSPAADRNKEPILECLRKILPAQGAALEIASGTGQHVSWFAAALPGWSWQPTEADEHALPAIAQRTAPLPNVLPPLRLDVLSAAWPTEGGPEFGPVFDAVFCANMLHITPWATCGALMRGSARCLKPGGVLVTYGPYIEEDTATAPGNVAFDQSLRERNPAWGIRKLEEVRREARLRGLELRARHPMPANNLLLVFGGVAKAS